MVDNNISEGLTILLSWKFFSTSLLIYSLLFYVKKIFYYYNKEMLKNKYIKIILTLLNPIFGIIVATIPNFLPGNNFIERAVAGILAGFLSSYFYNFLRRFLKDKGNNLTESKGELK